MAKGIIKRYDFRKGFGFIADDKTGEDFFFHKSEWQGNSAIRKDIAVKFVIKESDKGPQAQAVSPLEQSNKKPKAKPASIEDRVASLETTISTLKVVSFLALAGVIALAVEIFI